MTKGLYPTKALLALVQREPIVLTIGLEVKANDRTTSWDPLSHALALLTFSCSGLYTCASIQSDLEQQERDYDHYQLTCIERIAEESEGQQRASSSVPASTTEPFCFADRQVTTTNTLTKGIRYR